MTTIQTTTEYAVRAVQNGETTVTPAEDEVIARQTVAELLERGVRAAPVVRTVTEWQVDESALARARRDAAREQVLLIAQAFWEQDLHGAAAIEELRPFAPDMSDRDRAQRLGDLIGELEHQEDVAERRTAKVRPGPGQDWQTLEEDAERRVYDAADELIEGTPDWDVLMESMSRTVTSEQADAAARARKHIASAKAALDVAGTEAAR